MAAQLRYDVNRWVFSTATRSCKWGDPTDSCRPVQPQHYERIEIGSMQVCRANHLTSSERDTECMQRGLGALCHNLACTKSRCTHMLLLTTCAG